MTKVCTPTRNSTKWKLKLRSLYKSRTSLLESPLSGYISPATPEADFLTPLDVYCDEYFTPLTNQKDLSLGELTLPPPPPPQRPKWGLEETDSPGYGNRKSIASGPRVKPYFASSNQRQTISETCFICEELLETTLYLEKLVPLSCGDRIHEECLRMATNHQLEQKMKKRKLLRSSSVAEMMHAVYPTCHGELCRAKNETNMAIPVNSAFLDDLNADLRLSMKLARFEMCKTPDLAMESRFPSTESPRTVPGFGDMNEYVQPASESRKASLTVDTSLSNSFDGRSSILSNFSVDTTNTASVRVSAHANVPPEELKLAFIQRMIDQAPAFDLSMLVSLGKLRLVDKLYVSTTIQGAFEAANVYLFTNFLVIWTDTNASVVTMPLTQNTAINTPIPSVLQITSSGPDGVFNIRLHSEIGSIIEKWGIAISDKSMVFPSNLFSSTLRLPDAVISHPVKTRLPKPKVSPILESSSEFSQPIPERSPQRELQALGITQFYDTSSPLISRPTSPLHLRSKHSTSSESSTNSSTQTDITEELLDESFLIKKAFQEVEQVNFGARSSDQDTDSDSDEDLDCELIERVMNSR